VYIVAKAMKIFTFFYNSKSKWLNNSLVCFIVIS